MAVCLSAAAGLDGFWRQLMDALLSTIACLVIGVICGYCVVPLFIMRCGK